MRQISCLGTPLNSWSAGDNSSLAMAWWTDRNDETHLHWTGDGLGYGKGEFEGGGGGCACGKDASCHDPNQGGWVDGWRGLRIILLDNDERQRVDAVLTTLSRLTIDWNLQVT